MSNGILKNIDNYNEEMTISQVVLFFDRHGITMTKTMIQNYVRIEVLPPPVDKRYYTKKHIFLLLIIENLKSVFSMDEIKSVFSLIKPDPRSFDADIIEMPEIYKNFENFYNEAIEKMESETKKNDDLFLLCLKLMAVGVVAKQMVKNLI